MNAKQFLNLILDAIDDSKRATDQINRFETVPSDLSITNADRLLVVLEDGTEIRLEVIVLKKGTRDEEEVN